jgi:predicted PurR-regulated permease PerM
MSATNEASKSDDGVCSAGQPHSPHAHLDELRWILPLDVRSLALTGILLLLILYTLKLASTILIPIVLALLLNFLFASVIRGLEHFHVPASLGAVVMLLVLVGGLGFWHLQAC